MITSDLGAEPGPRVGFAYSLTPKTVAAPGRNVLRGIFSTSARQVLFPG